MNIVLGTASEAHWDWVVIGDRLPVTEGAFNNADADEILWKSSQITVRKASLSSIYIIVSPGTEICISEEVYEALKNRAYPAEYAVEYEFQPEGWTRKYEAALPPGTGIDENDRIIPGKWTA